MNEGIPVALDEATKNKTLDNNGIPSKTLFKTSVMNCSPHILKTAWLLERVAMENEGIKMLGAKRNIKNPENE